VGIPLSFLGRQSRLPARKQLHGSSDTVICISGVKNDPKHGGGLSSRNQVFYNDRRYSRRSRIAKGTEGTDSWLEAIFVDTWNEGVVITSSATRSPAAETAARGEICR
jgi:hypothetical protein